MPLTNNKRGSAKYTQDYGIKDAYKSYRQNGGTLLYDKFITIYEDFIYNALYHIIEKSADLRLPHRLGDICIRKRKIEKFLDEEGNLQQKYRKPDWERTLKLWAEKYGTTDKVALKQIKGKPLVYHDNDHTGGYTFYITWDKRTSNVKNQSKYVFSACRAFARAVKKIQNIKRIDYYEHSNKIY